MFCFRIFSALRILSVSQPFSFARTLFIPRRLLYLGSLLYSTNPHDRVMLTDILLYLIYCYDDSHEQAIFGIIPRVFLNREVNNIHKIHETCGKVCVEKLCFSMTLILHNLLRLVINQCKEGIRTESGN
jgi:hypothetical protein